MGGFMSSIVIQGDTSGSVTLQAPNVAGSAVITLPSTSGTLTSVSSLSNNGVVFADGAGQLTNNAGFTFDGTTLTTPGNTVLGDASTDTLNVGNGGLVKDASGNVGIGTGSPTGGANRVVDVYGSGSSAINFHNATSGTTATDGGVVGQYGNDLVLFNYEAGIIQFGTSNAERMRIDASGMVVPGVTATYDLGSTSLRWRNVYTSDLHLNNGIGNYTIVEGEEDLFLYNNKNGKTYKFALIEVDKSEAPPKMKED
jgi:hypothetical protein